MKKIIKFIILCIIFTHCSRIQAQDTTHVSIDSIYGFPTQALYGSSYTFYVLLHNYDSINSYQGQVELAFQATDNFNVIETGFFGDPFTVYIPADSVFSVTMTQISFDTSLFKLGGNVVVIWPVSTNGSLIMLTDTFHTAVEILGYSDISELDRMAANNNIYPVPANEMLFLPKSINRNNIEHVRIIDMLGRTRASFMKYPESISLAELENGFYFLEVKEKNNKINIYKFIISR